MPLPQSQKSNNNLFSQMAIDQAVMLNKLSNVEEKVDSIDRKLELDYVTQDQFEPVKKVVYGLVSLILVAVVGALIALVLIK